ncbi:hypothetical protein P4B35_06455, partial [Pontiellaceae bacterium B12227]|nr:hypothetical protein [Pontiellaceae bacterium B12227]
MNLSELTKEQKQYIVLGGIVLGAVIFGIVWGVKFSLSTIDGAKEELADLNGKIDRAEKSLSKSFKTKGDFEQSIVQLEEYLTYVTPGQNYYSWATEIVYSKGRKVGLEIESVDEVGMSTSGKGVPGNPEYLETYSLRITARGGFRQTKAFLREIEENHPLVRFSGLEIGKGMKPEVHEIQLFVQWPFKMDRIAALWEGQTRRNNAAVAENKSSADTKPAIEKTKAEVAVAKPVKKAATAPEEKKPEPVVAVVKPKPASRLQPTPPVEPVPEVKKPEPVVAVVKPKPAPRLQPTPPVEPVPEVKKPEP